MNLSSKTLLKQVKTACSTAAANLRKTAAAEYLLSFTLTHPSQSAKSTDNNPGLVS